MKSPATNPLRLICALLPLIAAFSNPAGAAPNAGDQTIQSYPAHGVVEQIAPDRSQITIHHQAIPGYMMEMTMAFPVKNTNVLDGVSVGDKIAFTLFVGRTNAWVEDLHREGHTDKTLANSASMAGGRFAMLKPGDMLPDGELVTEGQRQIRFSDLRGRAVAFTFFFTRCPLPNYCPLMNRNFDQVRTLLLSETNAPANWQLLSISFDPEFDTPQVLSEYAEAFRGTNAAHWLFADATTNTLSSLAPRLGLMVMHQGDSISHNLRTVVLDPEGRIFRQFNGNQWTAQQLADAIRKAAQRKTP